MVKFGRRPIFIAGVLIAAVATFAQGIAILLMNFTIFCVALMCLGIARGCVGFYRYAAADSAEESQKPRAISYVLAGGLLVAFLGLEISRNAVGIVPGNLYTGGCFSIALMQLASLMILSGIDIPKPNPTATGAAYQSVF